MRGGFAQCPDCGTTVAAPNLAQHRGRRTCIAQQERNEHKCHDCNGMGRVFRDPDRMGSDSIPCDACTGTGTTERV